MGLNEVFLTGTLTAAPELQLGTGTPCATGRLCVEENNNGQPFRLYVPVEVWGKAVEAFAELSAGDLILARGKLRWRKTGEKQGQLVVSVWSVQPLVQLASVHSLVFPRSVPPAV